MEDEEEDIRCQAGCLVQGVLLLLCPSLLQRQGAASAAAAESGSVLPQQQGLFVEEVL
eukprot:CAMPEP_0202909692 /NCGR_PEP_ID=MMETSP1392-20130828/50080_1 /ASSEMBLY_ACC=CAM_ASM_000868 /TAXON_ID=225041 /ORGANISM="Chlamydomonas chlamydogama, Strain SAG 11-48b" /LENGTH=57 /DNA_ID=CAMNT_0049599537 /DNA_START=42 /DNA_END=212 /DNA_ORIENTATION=+